MVNTKKFDKTKLKQQIEDNVRSLYRKNIKDMNLMLNI